MRPLADFGRRLDQDRLGGPCEPSGRREDPEQLVVATARHEALTQRVAGDLGSRITHLLKGDSEAANTSNLPRASDIKWRRNSQISIHFPTLCKPGENPRRPARLGRSHDMPTARTTGHTCPPQADAARFLLTSERA